MRPAHALTKRTKIAISLAVLLPSVLTEALSASAGVNYAARVEVGRRYQIRSSVSFTANCSGCSDQSSPPIDDARLTLKLTTDAGAPPRTYTFDIPGNGELVSPASGIVQIILAKPSEQLVREFKDKCSDPRPGLREFSLEPR